MRYFGPRWSPRPGTPSVPDSIAVFALAANTGQAADYPSDAAVMRVAFSSSAGAALGGVFNGNSTAAAWASTHTATAGTTAADSLIPAGVGEGWYQRALGSTGYSIVSPTSGYCHIEFWRR